MGDFTTAVKYGMNITHILLNNEEFGKISKEQRGGISQSGKLRCTIRTSLNSPSFAAAKESASTTPIRCMRR